MHSYVKLHPDDEAKIDALLALLRRVEDRLIAMAIKDQNLMKDISDILAAVTAETSLASAAALALQAASSHYAEAQSQIDALKAQLAANSLDPAQVQTLLDSVATASAQLSAAIPANVTPPPVVVEQPVAIGAGTVVTATGTNAPGTVLTPTEGQAADPLTNNPAVPVAVDAPVAGVVVDPAVKPVA